jgi:diadenosine tetraphosphate (Ap4A) HIT family hydrolase
VAPTPTLLPGTIVEEGATWTIAVNRNQNLLGKCLVVLKRPCRAVPDLTPDEWTALHATLARVSQGIERCFHPDRLNYAFLMNEDPQVHMHVLPRYRGPREWNGQRFDDPHWGRAPGHEQHPLAPDDLERLATEIRRDLTPSEAG